MVAVRPGFRRFAVSLQYHGSPFLGFAHQGDQENCILPDGTDLRGYVSVESRLRQALHSLLGSDEKYENIQVSSRTDRGVHAVKNTLHVDIRTDVTFLRPESIHRGLNFYLARPNEPYDHDDDDSSNYETSPVACKSSDGSSSSSRKRLRNATQYMRGGEWVRKNPMDEVRILAVKEAPRHMPNPLGPVYYNQEPMIDWNARFSATGRTYVYRILHTVYDQDWAAPFEWDRSWRVCDTKPLDVPAMCQAAAFLLGTHDFTSFRAARCQRHAPVMTLSDIQIRVEPYGPLPLSLFAAAGNSTNNDTVAAAGVGLLGLARGGGDRDASEMSRSCQLATILYQGDSFLYHQVRNMTGCLVQVGRGKLQPEDVRDILEARERRQAPQMAPAHGLFLVDVQHEGIHI